VSDYQTTMLMLGSMWIAWGISCKWMGLFNVATAFILAAVTFGAMNR